MVGGGTSASISQIVITDLGAKVKKKERQQTTAKVPRLEKRLPAMWDHRKAKNGPQI